MNPSPRDLPPTMAERLIVAVDVPTIAQARAMIARLDGQVSFFKIGLHLAFAEGIDGLIADLVRAGRKLFLDCKMYDIDLTVEEGIRRVAARGVSFVTVHGEPRMLAAAVRGRGTSALKLFAVSVLTSLDDAALREMGYSLSLPELVALRVRQTVASGCDGLIASAADNPDALRRIGGNDRLLIATPGIRPAGTASPDQRRPATPAAAIAAGADYLVVGRPIVAAPDPAAAAAAIIAEMEAARDDRRWHHTQV